MLLLLLESRELKLFRKSDRLAEKDQIFRVQAVNHLLQESVILAEEQISELRVIKDKIDSQAQISTVILGTLRSGICSLTQVRTIIVEIRNALELFQNLVISQQSVPSGIDSHWKQAPITMELATGKQIPVPLELVTSWDILDTILSELFKKHPAHDKIQRKEFAIEHGSTGREISREWAFDMAFRPGEKVDMAMTFVYIGLTYDKCPNCRVKYSPVTAESRIKCKSCGIWFQQIVETYQIDQLMVKQKSLFGSHILPKTPNEHMLDPKEFAIEHGSTGREINRGCPFDEAFPPGKKIDLAMFFVPTGLINDQCPRCQVKYSPLTAKSKVECKSCGMWFQHIVEVCQTDQLIAKQKSQFGSYKHILDPKDFQRVRLLQSNLEFT